MAEISATSNRNFNSLKEALEIWQQVVDESFEDKELIETFKKNGSTLQKAAAAFLEKMIDKEKGYLLVQEHIKHVRKLRKGGIITEENQARYDAASAAMHDLFGKAGRDIFEAVEEFQRVLNETLDQKVQMAYVYEDKNGTPFIYEIDNDTLLDNLKYDYTRSAFTGRINFSPDTLNNMKQIVDKSNKGDINHLNATYKTIMDRYRETKRQIKDKQSPYIKYEYPPGTWNKLTISTQGDINEAYAAIILNRQSKTIFESNNMEKNIAQYAEYIKQVDNTSGLLEGDITVGNIEYAIKSAQAGMLGVSQMINIAKRILNILNKKGNAILSKEDLQKEKEKLHNKGKTRNVQTIEGKMTKEVQDALDKIDKFDTSTGTWQ